MDWLQEIFSVSEEWVPSTFEMINIDTIYILNKPGFGLNIRCKILNWIIKFEGLPSKVKFWYQIWIEELG